MKYSASAAALMNSGVPKSAITSSKPGGVSDFAMSVMTGSCLGANRIFVGWAVAACGLMPGPRGRSR